MSAKKLQIDEYEFEWGKTFEEVIAELDSENLFDGHSSWMHFETECKSILDLKSLACSIRAPSLKRPVLQVSFDLAPVESTFFQGHHSPYVNQISRILGRPSKRSRNRLEGGMSYNTGHASSRVIYNCKWQLDNILVSLSVFGGIRSRELGEYAAGLYFDWLDERESAEPYMNEFLKEETLHSSSVRDIKKFSLKFKQRAFHRNHYELKNPYGALSDESIRTAQLAMYTSQLYRTPSVVASELGPEEVALFKAEQSNVWCICNKWDFTPVTENTELVCCDIKPARGSGSTHLTINDLIIQDERESEVIESIISALVEMVGLDVKRTIGYDD